MVQRLDEPSTGAGEEVMGATTAAIANAFFDATGVRLRQYPMTPERVKAALRQRGREIRRFWITKETNAYCDQRVVARRQR